MSVLQLLIAFRISSACSWSTQKTMVLPKRSVFLRKSVKFLAIDTYGCMHGDGSGIVCSGVTANQKKTCSTFRTGSFPSPKLPTREEAGKAEETEKK